MCNCIQTNSYDPTRTTTLRNAFSFKMARLFNDLTRDIREAVKESDVFGLKLATYQSPGARAFDFPQDKEKIKAFVRWLQIKIENSILQADWTDVYVLEAYKRGVIRANYELRKAGFDIPTIESQGGLDIVLSSPLHINRVELLYTRVFDGLKGITANMDLQISRILAQGMIDGDGPALLSRKLVSTINGTGMGELGVTDSLGRFIPAKRRAEMLARTEIIRAHHQGMMQEYINWRTEGLYVQAEWSTAGDNRVCSVCAGMEGNVYKIEEINSMIPAHPMCRCIALPYKKETDTTRTWDERPEVRSGQLPELEKLK